MGALATPPRTVGVIGGMGPAAALELMRRVIAMTPAQDDQDHIHVILDNNPQIPSRIKHVIERTGADPTPALVRMARGLEASGAQALAMPCNTAHYYADDIRRAVQIPLLDMVALTALRIARQPGRRVGVLASTAVLLTQQYDRALGSLGCALREPAAQADIMALISAVKRGEPMAPLQQRFADIAVTLARDCDVLLVACTELSLLAASLQAGVPVVDSLDVLAGAVVEFARS
jgi:aspartate racemase